MVSPTTWLSPAYGAQTRACVQAAGAPSPATLPGDAVPPTNKTAQQEGALAAGGRDSAYKICRVFSPECNFFFSSTHKYFVSWDHPSLHNSCASDCFSHELRSTKLRWKARGGEMPACCWQPCDNSSEVRNSASCLLPVPGSWPHCSSWSQGSGGSVHIFPILIELCALLALLWWEWRWQRPGHWGTTAGVSLVFKRFLFNIKVLPWSVAASYFCGAYLSAIGTRGPHFMLCRLWFQTESVWHLSLSVVFKCYTKEAKKPQCLI